MVGWVERSETHQQSLRRSMMGIASLHPSYEARLPLPVADAAGLAGPGLDPRVARLRVERIGVATRQLGAGGSVRFLGALVRHVSRLLSALTRYVRLGRR